MGFKCAIIGLPNVGKSTLFNALTKAGIEAANFPFCTIKPNIGIVTVPDYRINKIAEIVKPLRTISTRMEFVDIAGLVKGASKGEGLGNQFLNNIRETEAITHVVRCFEKETVIHVAGRVSPTNDISIINTELALSDLETCERAIRQTQKQNKGNNTDTQKKLLTLEKCLLHLNDAKMLRTLSLSNEEKRSIQYLKFLTIKPMMYIANVDEDGFNNNCYLDEVNLAAATEGSIAISLCAAIESDIAALDKKEDREAFIVELKLQEPGLNKVIRAGYTLLNLQTYFTAGKKEVRAWTISVGDTALQAARKIHTDLERGFIRAQIISFSNFIAYRGEQGAKEAGKVSYEGKDYTVKDGDIINFLFNV